MPAVSQDRYEKDMAALNERLIKLEESHRQEWAAEGAEAEDVDELTALYGTKTANLLMANGFTTVAQVKAADDETLLGISGIKEATLEKIRAAKAED